MRIILVLLVSLVSLVIFVVFASLVGNSYAQSSEQTRQVFIFVQTQIRNSDGQLVAYLEANKIFLVDLDSLNGFLDTLAPQQKLSRAGQNYDLFKTDIQNKITSPSVISTTALGTVLDGKEVLFAYSDHDGYPLVSGDTVRSIWTIIRPTR